MKNILKVFLVVFSLGILWGVFCDQITHHRNWRKLPEDYCGKANPKIDYQERFPWSVDLIYKNQAFYNKLIYVEPTDTERINMIVDFLSSAAAIATKAILTGQLPKETDKVPDRQHDVHPEVFCGGVLLNPLHVLTVAYCVDGTLGEDLKGVHLFGKYAIFEQDIFIKKVILHEGFTKERRENDIALIVLEKPANISEFVHSICFPRQNIYQGGYIAVPFSKQVENVSIAGIEKCQEEFSLPLNNDEICAINPMGQRLCPYYSGGPIMKLDGDGRYVLMGLDTSSWCGNFSVYNNVTYFTQWILDNLE